MAEHGAKVVVSSRKQAGCDAVTAEITAAGGQAGQAPQGARRVLPSPDGAADPRNRLIPPDMATAASQSRGCTGRLSRRAVRTAR